MRRREEDSSGKPVVASSNLARASLGEGSDRLARRSVTSWFIPGKATGVGQLTETPCSTGDFDMSETRAVLVLRKNPQPHALRSLLCAVALAFIASACGGPQSIVHELDEAEANEILVALEAKG